MYIVIPREIGRVKLTVRETNLLRHFHFIRST